MNASVNQIMATQAFEFVKVSDLCRSPTNPRRSFPEDKLREMADSVARHGVLQPVLLRPWPEGLVVPSDGNRTLIADFPRYEVIAGERRCRAALLAGVAEVPATVRQLSDNEVLEIQIIENLQREEVHPLEEAEGYQVLMLRTGCSAEDLAAKVGKSKAYIYARLKLCAITGKAREAFLDGKIPASTALLIARIPVPAVQQQAAEDILDGYRGDPLGAREAAEHIQRQYMLRLSEAPFPRGDAKLLEGAGTCAKCPKRTGNQPELFADVKSADVCTDPECWAQKREAWKESQIAAAEKRGQRVIVGDEAKKIAPYGISDYSNLTGGWAPLINRVWRAPGVNGKTPTWRDLVGPEYQAPVLLEDTRAGTMHEIAKEDELLAAAKANGVKFKATSVATGGESDREREKKAKAESAYRALLLDRILFAHAGYALEQADLVDVARALWNRLGSDGQKQLCKILNGTTAREDIDALEASIATVTASELNRLMLAMALIGQVHVASWHDPKKKPETLLAAAERWGVDAALVKKQAEFIAPKKAKAPKAKG